MSHGFPALSNAASGKKVAHGELEPPDVRVWIAPEPAPDGAQTSCVASSPRIDSRGRR